MTLDVRLRITLDEEAGRVAVPPPTIASIMEGGAARARRRRAVAGGMVAAIALAILAASATISVTRPSADPSPAPATPSTVDEMPLGDAPAMAHCAAGRTVLGGRTVWDGCGSMVSRGGTTVVLTPRGTELVTARGLVFLARDSGSWFPAVSQDGEVVALLSAGQDGLQRLEIFDVRDPTEVRRVADEPLGTPAAWVAGAAGVAGHTRVYAWKFPASSGGWVYDVDERELLPITGLPSDVIGPGPRYVTPDGVGLLRRTFQETGETTDVSVEGVVDADGSFRRVRERPIGWSSWSPDGQRLVQETRAGWWVQPADVSSHTTLRVPAEGRVADMPVWESDHDLLVPFDPAGDPDVRAASDPDGDVSAHDLYVLRCSADDGECEVAQPPGQAPADVFGALYH